MSTLEIKDLSMAAIERRLAKTEESQATAPSRESQATDESKYAEE